MQVSQRIRAIKPSPTLAMNAKAVAMRQAGIDVISFEVFDEYENAQSRNNYDKPNPNGKDCVECNRLYF